MTPDEKKVVRAALKAAGIPNIALKTSLLTLGQNNLRQHVVDRKWQPEKGVHRGFYLSPAASDSAAFSKSELVFKVLAKELIREGCKVYVISLLNLLRRLRDKDYDFYDTETELVNRPDIVFITGFYWKMEDVMPFQESIDKTRFIDWMLDRYDRGQAIACSSTNQIIDAKSWWPQFVLSLIAKNVDQFIIS